MSDGAAAGTFALGDRLVNRLGYGAMQLAGPSGRQGRGHRRAAGRREARHQPHRHKRFLPHITDRLIREALHPYPDDLVIVTKVGALRGLNGSVYPKMGRERLIQAVHDNLRNLGVQPDARLNILHHAGERQAMEWEAICFNVCMAAVLLIFVPAKSPQRDVQL